MIAEGKKLNGSIESKQIGKIDLVRVVGFYNPYLSFGTSLVATPWSCRDHTPTLGGLCENGRKGRTLGPPQLYRASQINRGSGHNIRKRLLHDTTKIFRVSI
jgi:hypothetical protein